MLGLEHFGKRDSSILVSFPSTEHDSGGIMSHISVNGVNIEYWESGEGFPLIWAHEFAGSSESWLQQVHYLMQLQEEYFHLAQVMHLICLEQRRLLNRLERRR